MLKVICVIKKPINKISNLRMLSTASIYCLFSPLLARSSRQVTVAAKDANVSLGKMFPSMQLHTNRVSDREWF